MSNIGKKITDLRKNLNLSQQDLAEKLNVSNKTISKWECGNGTPDIETVIKLASIFNISVDELIKDDKSTNTDKTDNKKSISKKKKILFAITIPVTFLIILLSTLLYFFIPRNPIISSSDLFEIDNTSSTATCSVDNTKSLFSFSNSISVPLTNSWAIYYDLDGVNEIKSKTVNLQVGDNTFYLVVSNSSGAKKIYTILIRRKPIYVVEFNTNGGNAIESKNIQEGNLLTYQEPEREGYIFNGWDYDFSTPIKQNTIINASWIAKNLTITYFANNGSELFTNQNIIYDTQVALKSSNEFSLKGYSLTSWNTKADGSGNTYSVNKVFSHYNLPENTNLYAQWTINQYLISVEKNINNAGTVYGSGNFDFGSTNTIYTTTNNGYTWLGWYSLNDQLITSSQSLTVTLEDKNVEFLAKWSANTYTITLNVNDGNELSQNTKILTFGEAFVLPTTTKTEAIFIGWYDIDNNQYTNSQGISTINWNKEFDTTLFAHYNINQYQVSCNKNIESAGNTQGNGLKDYGSNVILNATTNDGYEFVGWFEGTTLLSTNTQYQFIMYNYPVIYTAKWQANNYTITMDVNNGIELVENSKTVTYNNAYTLPITTKEGYNFAGWYLGVNGTGTQLTDNNGNSLSSWNIADNRTIYAKWTIITYNITYVLNNGNFVSDYKTTYTIEDLDITLTNPVRSGYVFDGWIGTDISEKTNNLIIPAGSVGDRNYGASWIMGSNFVAISTPEDFINIKNNLNGYYYLTSDIDLTDNDFSIIGSEANPFNGIIEGNGFYINSSSTLIYNLNGRIENIIIKNSSLCTLNYGTITKCISQNKPLVSYYNYGTISNCIAEGNNGERIDHKGVRIGGFCLYNYGIISHCINNTNINITVWNGRTAIAAGISVGNYGSIEYCINLGNIETNTTEYYEEGKCYAIADNRDNGTYIHCYCSTACEIIQEGNHINSATSTPEQLKDKNYIKYGEYINETDMIMNPENVWVFDSVNYPTLYWNV